jgi:hypothetical protein
MSDHVFSRALRKLEKDQAFSTDDPLRVLPRIRRVKNKIGQVRKITGLFLQREGGILLL